MSGQDANADPLTFSLVSGPAGASVSGNTVTWTPTATQVGLAQAFKTRLSDGKGGTADQDWSVTPAANASPAFTTTPSLIAKEGHPYTYTSGTSDTDGDTVNVTAVSLPVGATFNGGQIAWTPASAQVGVAQTFTLRATDGFGGQKDQTWSVTAVANASPVFTTTPQTLGAVGTPYRYTPAASDTDDDAISFALVSAPTGATLTNGTIQWMPQSAQAGTPQVFLVRASDGFGKTADQTWTIYLRASNAPPVISSVPPTTATSYYSYTILATDPDGDALTYSLDIAPTGAFLSTSPGVVIGWNPTPSQERVPSAFTLKVTDALGASATQSWTVTPNGTIRGTRILNAVTDTGDVPKPDDMSLWSPGTLAAVVPNGTGGFDTINGTGLADGTFTIPAVPGGSYWFKSGINYFWTDSSSMDLGYDQGGRSDSVTSANASTQLAFTMAGMNAWQSADDLQWTVSNTGYWDTLFARTVLNPPAIGATALSSTTISWQGWSMNDAGKGDQPYLTQLATRATTTGENYQAIAKMYKPVPFTQVDGSIYTVTGTFLDVPQTGTVRLNVARSQFLQFQSQVHPGAAFYQTAVAVDAQPGGITRGWLSNTPDLLTWFPAANSTDIDLGDLAYGNPFPAAWTPFVVANFSYQVPYQLPGTTSPATLYPAVATVTDQMPTASSPLRPLVGPVQSPKVNAQDFHVGGSGMGLAPLLSWVAPSLGSPTGYRITILRLYNNGAGATTKTTAALLYTKTNSITVPPRVLLSGFSYCFQITATSQPGVDYATGPYRKRIPYGFASAVSGVFTP